MELFLNLAWLVLSAALVLGYVALTRSVLRRQRWTIFVALALLILVLLPAISMTDDLAAINNLAEADHVFRRHEAPLFPHADVSGMVSLLVAIFVIGVARIPGKSIETHSHSAKLRDGMVCAFGVRPPPFATSLAA